MKKRTIDETVSQFYESFTETGDRIGELKNLFDRRGQVSHFLPDVAKTFTISEFIKSRVEILVSGAYKEFKEYEVDSKTLINGRNAVRISEYQKEGEKNGQVFKINGTKVFQLRKSQDNWKILSLTWMDKAVVRPIELRLVTEEDAPFLYDLMTGANWLTQIGDRGIKTVADAKQYILDKMHPELNVKGFVNHVIIDAETKEEVGTCSLHNREGVEGLDIGYAILESFEGNGYALTSAQKMVELAFQTYGAEIVSAITTDGNVGSCRVVEKIGFRHDGYVQLPNGDERLRLYTLHKRYFFIN